jgi:diguanylate cyclase (GGDEF)-like protein/PAS domain S-box-containing protein
MAARILVVEDDNVIGRQIEQILTRLGYEVAGKLASGEDAVRQVEEFSPNLILMDIMLAGKMDGVEAAEQIKQKLNVPIIYLTSMADDATLQRAKITAPFGYILKPFDERILQITLETALYKFESEKRLAESEKKFRTLVETQSEGIILVDPNEKVYFANRAAESILGVGVDELVGKNMSDFAPEDQFEIIKAQTRLRKKGEKTSYELGLIRPDGKKRNILMSGAPWLDKGQAYNGSLGIFSDITEQKMAIEAERDQRALAEALRDSAAALTSTLDLDEVLDRILTIVGRVVLHEAANIMLLEGDMARPVKAHGYAERGLDEVVKNERLSVTQLPTMKRMVETGKPVLVADTRKWEGWKDLASSLWVNSYVAAPIQIKGEIVGFINLVSSQPNFFKQSDAERLRAFADQAAIAIENARLYQGMQQLAMTDDLTGLYNRRGLLELGQREVQRAHRFDRSLTLIWMDVDHFKDINDAFGHEKGNEVLRKVIERCKQEVREIDIFSRYGGDEFIIILPETGLEGGVQVAERLCELARKIDVSSFLGDIHVTASFGVAMLGEKVTDLNALMMQADQAMYAAKQAGRDRVVSFK